MLQKSRLTKNYIKVICQASYIEHDPTLICLDSDTQIASSNHRTGVTIWHADLDIRQLICVKNNFGWSCSEARLLSNYYAKQQ